MKTYSPARSSPIRQWCGRWAGRWRSLAGLLEGKGVSTVEETSNVLGIYAVITGETAPDEGLILACWAECCVMRHRKGRKDGSRENGIRIGQRGRAGWGEPLALLFTRPGFWAVLIVFSR
jgi:hypothetical protein